MSGSYAPLPPLKPSPLEGAGASLLDDAALRLGAEARAGAGAGLARLAPPMLAAMLAASVFLVAGSCGSAGLADFGSSRVVPDELPVDEPEAVTELGLVAVVGLVAVGAVGVGGEPIEFDGVSEVPEP